MSKRSSGARLRKSQLFDCFTIFDVLWGKILGPLKEILVNKIVRVEPHPEVAPIIKQIFEWYATGQCSLTDVPNELSAPV